MTHPLHEDAPLWLEVNSNSQPTVRFASPFFSIVIPTRNRPALARTSARHVLSQDFTDLELILLDNSDSGELSAEEFNDVRCRVVPSSSVLTMRDNWERGLEIANGTYLLILSDKDMLVPGALTRLAVAAKNLSADMLTFRKANYGTEEGFVSSIQRCSGRISEHSTESVLTAWFKDVRHFHDAPMLYNSAVRRDLLVDLRMKAGRFFAGTSPDIASGAILMAKLRKYHLIDRPLVVSWYGNWSIGVAASRGATGAAAAFVAEHCADPIRDAGLVTGIPGSVAETLLECKRLHPSLFVAWKLRWSGYVASALWDLLRRRQVGINVAAEQEYLLSTRDRQYSWLASRAGLLRFRWEHADLRRRVWMRILKGAKSGSLLLQRRSPRTESHADLSPEFGDGLGSVATQYFRVPVPSTRAFRDVPYFSLPLMSDVEQVVALADEINRRLDGLEEGSVD